MATPLKQVYSAFLVRILEDEWGAWLKDEVEADWKELLDAAIPWFKFPRKSLEHDQYGFDDDLSNEEIQILAAYMKCEWLNRCIMTWENIKPLYEERDFSQANLLDKLVNTLTAERKSALALESIYYRSIKGRSYHYHKLATSGLDNSNKHRKAHPETYPPGAFSEDYDRPLIHNPHDPHNHPDPRPKPPRTDYEHQPQLRHPHGHHGSYDPHDPNHKPDWDRPDFDHDHDHEHDFKPGHDHRPQPEKPKPPEKPDYPHYSPEFPEDPKDYEHDQSHIFGCDHNCQACLDYSCPYNPNREDCGGGDGL